MESPERMEILRMVADHVITVEEAERLLRALADGKTHGQQPEAKTEESGRDSRSERRRQGSMAWLDNFLADLGPAVHGIVSDAIGSLGIVIDADHEKEEGEAEVTTRVIELSEQTELHIVSGRRERGDQTGDVTIRRGAPGQCQILNAGARLRVRQTPHRLVMVMPEGNLELAVPERVRSLNVKLLHGHITVSDINAPINLKTLGGNITATNLCGELLLKTMGGHITTHGLKPTGRSAMVTMGGHLTVGFAESASVQGRAVTMGGDVYLEPEIQGNLRRSHFVHNEAAFTIGTGEHGTIKIKTMGGNIRIGITAASSAAQPEASSPLEPTPASSEESPTPPIPPVPPNPPLPPDPPESAADPAPPDPHSPSEGSTFADKA